jgi:hypothetical protein
MVEFEDIVIMRRFAETEGVLARHRFSIAQVFLAAKKR